MPRQTYCLVRLTTMEIVEGLPATVCAASTEMPSKY
jgi:hypothetical protein